MSNAELFVGDRAPSLHLHEFLKGEPITGFTPGTVSVVEFWSPTCGPCVKGIPHLSELQATYPQVVVLGVAMEPSEETRAFVRQQGEAMAYTVATDAPPVDGARSGPTYQAWCDASFQQGIPSSFVVDGDGVVAWIGHPIDLDEPLAAILEGRWDLAARAEEYRAMIARTKQREIMQMFTKVGERSAAKDVEGILRVYDETFAAHPDIEQKQGIHKLVTLVQNGRSEVIDYARHLIALAPGDDGGGHLQVGSLMVMLLEMGLGENRPTDPAVINFALESLLAGEASAAATASAKDQVEIHKCIASAFLLAGRPDEARARARTARDLAETADLNPAQLARIDALVERCAAAAAAAPPAPKPEMICEDGVCRIVPA